MAGPRITRQRTVILEILRGCEDHPSADWIYEQARLKLPEISLGTVYRNLSVLRNSGEIMEHTFGGRFNRYDGVPDNHYHFSCEKCGRLLNISLPLFEGVEETVARLESHLVQTHRLEFRGVCRDCLTALDRH